MAFSLDTFRNLFTGQKPEQTQPSFTPASGSEIKPNVDKIMASVETASLSELQKHDQTLIDRFNFITQEGRFPREARELSETIGRLYGVIEARLQGLEVNQVGVDQVQERSREELIEQLAGYRQDQAEIFSTGEYHLSHEQQAEMDLRQLEQENPGLPYAQLLEHHSQQGTAAEAENSPEPKQREDVERLSPERIGASQANIQQSYESAVTTLERFAEGLSRQPDVSKELKEAWVGFQRATPTAARSKTLGEATEALAEAYIAEQTQERQISLTAIGPDNLLDLLRSQEENIRQEWQSDLATGRQNEHDLETYFAGKVDQHNTLIELAVEANPKMQETLPPQINYEQLRSELQQQAQQKQQQIPAQAMEMAI